MTAKKFFYTMCGLLVVGFIAVGYGLYWANGQLSTRAAEIRALSRESDALDQQIINANKLANELEENEEIIAVANDVLPESKTQENIVAELITISDSLGIRLEGINFIGGASGAASPVSQADRVDGIPGVFSIAVSTSFETSYENLLNLLRELEGNKRRFEVTDIDITPIENDQGSVVSYATQLTILTYVRP